MRPGIAHVYGYCAVHTDGGLIATMLVCGLLGLVFGFLLYPMLRSFFNEVEPAVRR